MTLAVRKSIHGSLAPVVLALVLTGCASSAPTRFYTLEAAAPTTAPPVARAGPAIWVQAVHVPPAMDRLELTWETAPGQQRVSDFDRWAASPGQLARQALTQDLAARLPRGQVVFPDAPRPPGTSRLSVDVLSFDRQGDSATMQVGWTLSAPDGTSNPARGGQLRLEARSAAVGPPGEAQVFAALLGMLSDSIVRDVNAPDRP